MSTIDLTTTIIIQLKETIVPLYGLVLFYIEPFDINAFKTYFSIGKYVKVRDTNKITGNVGYFIGSPGDSFHKNTGKVPALNLCFDRVFPALVFLDIRNRGVESV